MFVEAMGVPLLPALVAAAAMAVISAPGGLAHSYHVGSCPHVKPMTGFNIQRFLGRWHVLQKTSTKVRCLTNDYSWTHRPEPMDKQRSDRNCKRACALSEWADEVEVAQPRGPVTLIQRMIMPVPGVNHGVRYTGSLSPNPDRDSAGAFLARFPLNMFGSASYVVLDTDYDDYAVVVSCQKILLWHRLSASIMSRKPFLESSTIAKLRRLLKGQSVDVDDLDAIRHSCDEDSYDKGIQVDIKPKVLHSNLTQIIEDSRDSVSAVSEVAKGAYDIYNALNGNPTLPLYDRRRRRRKRHTSTSPQAALLTAQWMP